MSDDLERFVPGLQGEIWYEHWHRYHWVRPLVAGLRVLDVASGEGYGSALLAGSAKHVTGVDIAADAVATAQRKYPLPNLAYLQGDGTSRLPLADASVDAVVSFETVEHFAAQDRFVAEIARVLAPGGRFIVSSPNRPYFNRPGSVPNPHHAREMDEGEFRALLAQHFPAQRWFAQTVDFHSMIAPWGRPAKTGEMLATTSAGAAAAQPAARDAKYFVCACAREARALEGIDERLSVLTDEEHYLLVDYGRLCAALALWKAEREQLLAQLRTAEGTIARLAVERNRALLGE